MWGLGVAIAIYCTAGVSGAHINPAVTIALALFHGFDKRKVLPYIVAQMLGAFCTAALIYTLYSNLFVEFEAANGIIRGSEASLATAGIFSTYTCCTVICRCLRRGVCDHCCTDVRYPGDW